MAKEISLPTDWTDKEAPTIKLRQQIGLTSFGVVFAIVTAAVSAAYYNSFKNGFHLDDWDGLIHNPWIRSSSMFRGFCRSFYPHYARGQCRLPPVLQTTYALNYAISQYNPWSWHLFNLILHIIVALSLYLLGRTLFGRGRIVETPGLTEEDGDLLSLGAALLLPFTRSSTALRYGPVSYDWLPA